MQVLLLTGCDSPGIRQDSPALYQDAAAMPQESRIASADSRKIAALLSAPLSVFHS